MRSLNRPTAFFALLGLLSVPELASGELTVIAEYPGSRPITDFTAPLTPRRREPDQHPALETPKTLTLDELLPIETPTLIPGPVEPRHITLPLHQPLFLIGSDARSRAWLAQNRERLKQLHAVGMLIEARTRADLEAIAAIADGLPITPASATDIAELLDLIHYPVLITRTGIEQ